MQADQGAAPVELAPGAAAEEQEGGQAAAPPHDKIASQAQVQPQRDKPADQLDDRRNGRLAGQQVEPRIEAQHAQRRGRRHEGD